MLIDFLKLTGIKLKSIDDIITIVNHSFVLEVDFKNTKGNAKVRRIVIFED